MKHGKPYACTVGIIAALCQFSSAAWAQTTRGDVLKELRRKADLIQADLDIIDGYLDDQITRLGLKLDTPKERSRFENGILDDYSHAENSPRFKNVFAERCSSRFGEKIKQGPAGLSLVLVNTLAKIANPATMAALKEAMNSPDAATRVRAIGGIYEMRREIEADPGLISSLITWLGNVGARETDGVVLCRIYQVFSFTVKKDEQVQALLIIFEARLNAFEKGTFNDPGAEVEAFQRLQELADALGDADKVRLAGQLARFLARYTHRYLYVDIDLESRQTLHRLVFMTERLLTAITTLSEDPHPVTEAMGLNSKDRHEKIREAFFGWTGTADKPGRLNGSPWQVPIGGGASDLDFSAPMSHHSNKPTPEP